MAEEWFTYPQLAQLWEMSQDAARTRARRGRFPRRVNNRGQTEVQVDSSAPPMRVRPPRSGRQTQTGATLPAPDTESPSAATVEALKTIAALEGHVATLKDQLAKAEAATAVERDRATDLMAQLLRLTGELLEARKAEQAPPRRSWWQRLTG